jgi:hypothetical protein
MTMSSLVSSTRLNGRDLADLGDGLHVDDSLAAARLEAEPVDVGPLALAHLRDREG